MEWRALSNREIAKRKERLFIQFSSIFRTKVVEGRLSAGLNLTIVKSLHGSRNERRLNLPIPSNLGRQKEDQGMSTED